MFFYFIFILWQLFSVGNDKDHSFHVGCESHEIQKRTQTRQYNKLNDVQNDLKEKNVTYDDIFATKILADPMIHLLVW